MKKASLDRSHFIMMFFAFSFGMILSNLIGQSHSVKQINIEPALFVYKGFDKTKNDLSPDMHAAISKLDEEKYHLLENAGLELHLHQYANDQQISLEEAGKIIFNRPDPSEKQVSKFYYDNAAKLDKPYFEVKDMIKKYLMNVAINQAKQNTLKSLKEKGDLIILFKP